MMTENQHLAVVNVFMDQLRRAGVRHICVSPGSRSTPLTMSLARHGGFKVWTLLDERSSGYFALGLSRRSKEPVALVCTSGTATANYWPAVMEARQSQVPLILITADRPPELQGVGSNQTVDQGKLYGSFVKWFAEMPVPEQSDLLVRHAAATAWRLVAQAVSAPAGPVHLNWPFREPLVPPRETPALPAGANAPVRIHYADLRPTEAAVNETLALLQGVRRGLIVCGPQSDSTFAEAVAALAARWGVPVLADPLSQVRCGTHDLANVIETYDVLLRNRSLWDKVRPDVVLRFGNTPTSKVLGQFLESSREARQVVVTGSDGWRDPFFVATDIVQADASTFCMQLAGLMDGSAPSDWLAAWQTANEHIRSAVDTAETGNDLFEGHIITELSELLPDGATLFAGNSMPVRDVDSFYPRQGKSVTFLANRGVSGIDGVVSSAVGAAAADCGPTVLVIGDVSFYHDLNGLFAAARHGLKILIVLVNNDGGGIFSFLPQSAYADTFEHFRTSHGLNFRKAVEMYGGEFRTVTDWAAFRDAVSSALETNGLSVVEVETDGDANVPLHQKVFDNAKAAVEDVVWPVK